MHSMTHSYIFVLIPSFYGNIIFNLIQSVSAAKTFVDGLRRSLGTHRLGAGCVGAAVVGGAAILDA